MSASPTEPRYIDTTSRNFCQLWKTSILKAPFHENITSLLILNTVAKSTAARNFIRLSSVDKFSDGVNTEIHVLILIMPVLQRL